MSFPFFLRARRVPALAAALALSSALAAASFGAAAHVVLEQPQAPAGSSYKATLLVGHGCEGQPTHTVTVQVPPGYRGVKPQPKPGWTITIEREPLAQPYLSHGKPVTERVARVRWSADSPASALADAHFDEFVLRGQLPEAPGPLWFAVEQRCPDGRLDWSEVPAEGHSTRGLKAPAALLRVEPAADPHAHH